MLYSYDTQAKSEYLPLGILASAIVHFFFFYQIYIAISKPQKLPPKIVYSVSIEKGEKLGGISQVPEKKKETKIAPPKKIKPVEPKPKPKPKEVVKVTKEVKPVKKKEVPKPAPKPKPKPKPEPKPKPQAKAKETEKSYEELLQKYMGESSNSGKTGFGAGKLGGKGMGGGVVKSPAWFRYKNALEQHVKQGWVWHDSSKSIFASVSFEIKPDGEIHNIKILKSSGNSKYDDSVFRAVAKANPAPKATPDIYPDFKHVIIDFVPGG